MFAEQFFSSPALVQILRLAQFKEATGMMMLDVTTNRTRTKNFYFFGIKMCVSSKKRQTITRRRKIDIHAFRDCRGTIFFCRFFPLADSKREEERFAPHKYSVEKLAKKRHRQPLNVNEK